MISVLFFFLGLAMGWGTGLLIRRLSSKHQAKQEEYRQSVRACIILGKCPCCGSKKIEYKYEYQGIICRGCGHVTTTSALFDNNAPNQILGKELEEERDRVIKQVLRDKWS